MKDGGRYGQTQSTVLTLKALVKYYKIYSGLKGKGYFNLYMNNEYVKSKLFDESVPLADFDFSKELN